jgi:hypothetical protein
VSARRQIRHADRPDEVLGAGDMVLLLGLALLGLAILRFSRTE